MTLKNYNQKQQKVVQLVKKEDDKPIVNHRRQRSVMIISSLFIAILLGIFILAPKIKNDLSKKYTIKENKTIQEKENTYKLSNDRFQK